MSNTLTDVLATPHIPITSHYSLSFKVLGVSVGLPSSQDLRRAFLLANLEGYVIWSNRQR
ncbi:MAG TPA: hypothetical protein VFO40_24485 [Chthoniobacterales bacterium]|nr:hypothetical protein [Chthoniobacterales bacterium]